MYKANILLNTSHTFAEEVYINISITLEAIIEYIKIQYTLKTKKDAIEFLDINLKKLKIFNYFLEYEEEMRESTRNNIIHPFRNKTLEKNAHADLDADTIFEDVPVVDIVFKAVLSKEFKNI